MANGHAGRTLAAIRLLDADTAALLAGLPQLDAGQSGGLRQAGAAGRDDGPRSGAGHAPVQLRPDVRRAAGSAARQGRCHV